MRIHLLAASLLLLVITSCVPAYAQKPKANEFASVQISIENCLDAESISVPVNKSYLVAGKGVSGGGISKECGSFSYAMYAVRQSKKKISIRLSVRVNCVDDEKDIIHIRGKKDEYQLGQGIKVVASY